jgi:hypothetical protein
MNGRLLLSLSLLGVVGCATRPAPVDKSTAITPPAEIAASHVDLDLPSLIALVNEIYPNRDYAASHSYYALWIDFRYFGVTTVAAARSIILENRGFAEAEEAEWWTLYGKNRSRADGGVPSESARSYNYNCVGMARHALRKHVGLDTFDDYELKGRPNQPPEPMSGLAPGHGSS